MYIIYNIQPSDGVGPMGLESKQTGAGEVKSKKGSEIVKQATYDCVYSFREEKSTLNTLILFL